MDETAVREEVANSVSVMKGPAGASRSALGGTVSQKIGPRCTAEHRSSTLDMADRLASPTLLSKQARGVSSGQMEEGL